MLSKEEAQQFASDWIESWNSRDLEAILAHYAPNVVLTSPAAARLLNNPAGSIEGIAALRAYFQRGLEAYPHLAFELREVLCGVNSVVLYFKNQLGSHTAEYMELDRDRKIVRVVANYTPSE
ncbi:MAG: nuclear transport factor 2 family protein [Acidobacteriaceae bacterium]